VSIIHPSFWSSQRAEAQVYDVVVGMPPEDRLPLLAHLLRQITPRERQQLREVLEAEQDADRWEAPEDD